MAYLANIPDYNSTHELRPPTIQMHVYRSVRVCVCVCVCMLAHVRQCLQSFTHPTNPESLGVFLLAWRAELKDTAQSDTAPAGCCSVKYKCKRVHIVSKKGNKEAERHRSSCISVVVAMRHAFDSYIHAHFVSAVC